MMFSGVRWLWWAGGGVLALAIGGGAWSVFHRQVHAPAATAANPAATVGNPIVRELTLEGKIQAREVVGVRVLVEGTIASFSAQLGDEVHEGEVLAEVQSGKLAYAQQAATEEEGRAQVKVHDLESGLMTARLEASRARADATRGRAQFEASEKTYLRQQTLMREGATPRLVFEKAEKEYKGNREEAEGLEKLARQAEERVGGVTADLDHAKAMAEARTQELENAKASVDAGEVRAPVNGYVAGRRGQVGDSVSPDVTDLFEIATDLSALAIHIEPAAADLARFKAGQGVAIDVVEAPGVTIAGTVREIQGGVVTIDFTSPSPAVRPGLTALIHAK